MYLRAIEIQGFKSFPEKTRLTFDKDIIAIVGPNGSGKSNISDAVLWVLGERSARNLRGQAMDDIIFSGSAARKAVSIAEVDLVLDNSDGTLPVEFDASNRALKIIDERGMLTREEYDGAKRVLSAAALTYVAALLVSLAQLLRLLILFGRRRD